MTPNIQILAAFFMSLLLVDILIPAIVRLSIAKKLFDIPNERRVNKVIVPNLGGIALFAGISVSSLLCIQETPFPDIRYIMVALIIMFYTGLKDDILMITPLKKFMAQILSAIVLAMPGGIRITDLHGLFGINEIGFVWSIVVSVFVIVAIINSMNLIDGIDGLASGLGILMSVFFGSTFFLDGYFAYAVLSFSITGGLIAFFFFNVFGKLNKIFMGDTGSLLLGLLFAILAIKYNEFSIGTNSYSFAPALSFAVISVPLFDMTRVFCVRLFHKRSPFMADMTHIHHKLLRLGFTQKKSTAIIVLTNLVIVCLIYFFRAIEVHFLLAIVLFLELLFSLMADFLLNLRSEKSEEVFK